MQQTAPARIGRVRELVGGARSLYLNPAQIAHKSHLGFGSEKVVCLDPPHDTESTVAFDQGMLLFCNTKWVHGILMAV